MILISKDTNKIVTYNVHSTHLIQMHWTQYITCINTIHSICNRTSIVAEFFRLLCPIHNLYFNKLIFIHSSFLIVTQNNEMGYFPIYFYTCNLSPTFHECDSISFDQHVYYSYNIISHVCTYIELYIYLYGHL